MTDVLPESLIATPPGEAYVDPAYFAREQERIFERMWFCAVRLADLKNPGSFRVVPVGRESVVVLRHRDGTVRAFINACRHRGARLCDGEEGEIERNIQCPYHAWTYGLDGKLIGAPNLASMKDIDRVEYGLHRVALREYLGYAWVNLADDGAGGVPSFEDEVMSQVTERLGDLAMIDAYGAEALELGRRIRYDVAANWKLIIENFMECYHCAHIHPELTAVLPEFAEGYAAQYYVGHGADFAAEVEGFTIDGAGGFERIPGISDDQDRKYYAITIKPTVFVNLVPDHVILHRMFPLAADRTRVECDWLFMPGVVSGGTDVSSSVELFHRVNEQDFEACERCQPNMTSRSYARGGVLVPSEHHIGEFHDWLSQRLSG